MSGNQRLIDIWMATNKALQGVVREYKITEDELILAGRFFNRLGQSGMFPSLLAVGLAMTSVDVTKAVGGGTRPNLEGPFYKPKVPVRDDGMMIDLPPGPGAQTLYLYGRITDAATGAPIAGAELDLWQANENGIYDDKGYNLRGIVRTGPQGEYRLTTLVPKDYSEHDHDPIGELFRAMEKHNRRAGHIHLKLRAKGYVPLTTQLFVPDSPYLDSDYVEGAVCPDLTLKYEDGETASKKTDRTAHFDFSLRSDQRPLSR
jgi:protocatechuate 3,4-dioxygenase beta subunit